MVDSLKSRLSKRVVEGLHRPIPLSCLYFQTSKAMRENLTCAQKGNRSTIDEEMSDCVRKNDGKGGRMVLGEKTNPRGS